MRGLGRRFRSTRFQGIRFRLGMAMAIALLPILVLGAVQTQAAFRERAEDQRNDLHLAAQRSAVDARLRLDGAVVMLQALSPESLGVYCEPRLTALLQRLDDYAGFYRLDPSGRIVCAARRDDVRSIAGMEAAGRSDWFRRLREGEPVTVTRPATAGVPDPAMIVAIRAQRPLGDFDGVMATIIPLAALRPDVSDHALPDGAEAALTDADGSVLTATSPSAFRLTGSDDLRGWVQRARDQGSAVFEAVDRSGQRRVYSGAAIAGRDVYILLSAPAPGLLSWARLNPISALLMPLAAWLTAFAAVMLLSDRIVVRWLDYLERIAAIYARGRFSVRPIQAMNAPSEIRVLARTLDEMAETISARDAALLHSLDEKDALMREIHHRVKNNLQIISSLLSMQQRTLTDPAAAAAVSDTRQRIAALALIYRTLYQSADISRADARDFLTELVGQLVAGAAVRGPAVTSSVEADSLIVDPDKLPPLALWLVEAVGNAQKHAFAERGGELKVRFRVDGETSVLEVQDDGPGREDDRRPGVGSALMDAFAKQLRGATEVLPAPGGGVLMRMTIATPSAPPL